jgi:hypothetical protein
LFLNSISLDNQAMISCFRCNDPITFKENVVSERSGKLIPLNEDLSYHDCPNSDFVAQVLECKYCHSEISFSNQVISPKGRKIPVNVGTLQKHECKEGKEAWKNNSKGTLNCRLCGEAIYFSDSNMSESGKRIPMEVLTRNNHNCPKRPFTPKNKIF